MTRLCEIQSCLKYAVYCREYDRTMVSQTYYDTHNSTEYRGYDSAKIKKPTMREYESYDDESARIR